MQFKHLAVAGGLIMSGFITGYVLGIEHGDDQYQLGRKVGHMEHANLVKAEKPDFDFAGAKCYLTKERYQGDIAGAGDQGYRRVVTK